MTTLKIKKAVYKLYLNLPFNKQLFSFLKRIVIPKYNIRKYLRFNGVFSVKLNSSEAIKLHNYGNTLENELFWHGLNSWESKSTTLWMDLCRRSKTILDIGANTGVYSVLAGTVNPTARILAFEPVKMIFERLVQNININKLKVKTFPMALAESDGEDKIYFAETVSDTFDQASLNPRSYNNRPTREVTISKKKLSTIIRDEAITDIDLMKIDVETFEPNVLRGMENFLTSFKPTMIIEILNETVAVQVMQVIDGLNYELYRIDDMKGLVKQLNLSPAPKGSNFLLLNRTKHEIAV
jgi:FkbM family methyltransferase